jgi:hypothetical protein
MFIVKSTAGIIIGGIQEKRFTSLLEKKDGLKDLN